MIPEIFSNWSAPAAAWILTFALHSSFLLGAAWLLTSSWRSLPDAVSELIWKSACVGAVLTASCQLALVSEPLAGHVAEVRESTFLPQPAPITAALDHAASAQPSIANHVTADAANSPVLAAADSISLNWEQWFLLVMLLCAGVGLIHSYVTSRDTRRLLRQRMPLRDGPAPAMLGRLCARVGYWRALRLSQHPTIQTPIAFGALRPEISLPSRAFEELGEQHQLSMLAHELGHLMRRDPLWLRVNGLLIALFPWQPLLRVARRRIQILAEYRSDALAAEITGNLDAASCLLEVAGWVANSKHPMQYAVTGMALRDSALKLRMDRLLSGDLPRALGRHRLWLLPLSTVLLTVATTVLPGASLQQRNRGEEEIAEIQTDSQDATVDLLGLLITQMDHDFDSLSHEVDMLREELADGPHKPGLTSMLDELDMRLASLERHRLLFEEVLEEWSVMAEPEPDTEPGTRK